MNDLFTSYQVCLVFSDNRDHCHEIQKLYHSYHISYDHEINETVIDICVCLKGIDDSEKCKMQAITSLTLVASAPQMEITREIWSLLLPSSDLYDKIRLGVLFGELYPDDLKLLIGISNDLRILTADDLDYCQSTIVGRVIHCCNIYKSISQCLPPVLDVGIFVFSRHFINAIDDKIFNNLLQTLKLVNGKALFLAKDLTFFEILDIFPISLLQFIQFETLPVDVVALRSSYRTIALVDLTRLWIPSASSPSLLNLNTLLPSKMSINLTYGFDTMTLENVCIFNRTNILFRSTPETTLSPEIQNLIKKTFPDWNLYETFQEDSSEVSWIPHTTLACTPPWTYSISHLIQTTLSLIHYLHYPSRYSWINDLKENFLFLIPTMYRDEFEWSFQFLSLLRNFFVHEFSREPRFAFRQDLQNLKYSFRSRSIPLANFESLQNSSISHLLCFEKLIFFAPTQISTPFVNENAEANALRNFAYDWIEGSLRDDSYFNSRNSANHDSSTLTPNHGLRVTLISRPYNRRILNLHDVIHVITTSGIADLDWFMTHGGGSTGGIYLESYPFTQQVQLMRGTDILICTHGSGTSNWIFLTEYSAVLEILTSPWYQMIAGTPIIMNIFHYNLFQTNRSASANCDYYHECLESTPVLDRGRCIPLRQCDTWVDLEAFEMLLNQLSHQVRIMKRNITNMRFSTSNNQITQFDSDERVRETIELQSYREGRRLALSKTVGPL